MNTEEKRARLELYRANLKVAELEGNIFKVESLKKDISLLEKEVDIKFLFILSPEMNRYLEWASERKRMHKAQIVRTAIDGMMSKDKQYKNTF